MSSIRFTGSSLFTLGMLAISTMVPAQAETQVWYYVNMDATAGPARQCAALPTGITPDKSLAEKAGEPVKKVVDDTTKEGGRLKVFVSQSGNKYRYVFADSVALCQTLRHPAVIAFEQRKLSDGADWLVADAAHNSCKPLSKLFPAVADVSAAHIPAEAEQSARRAGMQPRMKFISREFASLTVSFPGKEDETFTIFARKSACTAYVSGLHQAMAALSASSSPAVASRQRTDFGAYIGETATLKIGVETKSMGTALLVVNKTGNKFTFEPTAITLEIQKGKISPCTAHLMQLQGFGVATTVSVPGNAKEVYLLGACPNNANGGQMGDRLVIRQPITKVAIGGVEVGMHADY